MCENIAGANQRVGLESKGKVEPALPVPKADGFGKIICGVTPSRNAGAFPGTDPACCAKIRVTLEKVGVYTVKNDKITPSSSSSTTARIDPISRADWGAKGSRNSYGCASDVRRSGS